MPDLSLCALGDGVQFSFRGCKESWASSLDDGGGDLELGGGFCSERSKELLITL
jgi:hypothetical protein